MLKFNNYKYRKGERGNVLFLILIAVALFAALSYAVTSSSRSGGGDASSETNLVNSAQVTQYPASVRTSILRMIVASGIDATDLGFDPPPYTNCTDEAEQNCVFDPAGGGATYVMAPADVMADGEQGEWFFNGTFAVPNIGTNDAGDGNEIIAFLPGIKKGVCDRINEQLGIDVPTGYDAPDTISDNLLESEDFPSAKVDITDGVNTFEGQPYGCIYDTALPNSGDDAGYVYYHVLVER